jgi:hypothetical protein
MKVTQDLAVEMSKLIAINGLAVYSVRTDGTVGQTPFPKTPMEKTIARWRDIIAISTSPCGNHRKGHHLVGLKSDGTVVAAGDNTYGQCNVESWTDVVAIAAGICHTIGLTKDGRVLATQFPNNQDDILINPNRCYGQNDVANWKDVVFISASEDYSVGIQKDGKILITDPTKYTNDVDTYIMETFQGCVQFYPSCHSGVTKEGTLCSAYCMLPEEVMDRKYVMVSGSDGTVVGLTPSGTVKSILSWNDDIDKEISKWRNIVAISANHHSVLGLQADGNIVVAGSQGYIMQIREGWKTFENYETCVEEREQARIHREEMDQADAREMLQTMSETFAHVRIFEQNIHKLFENFCCKVVSNWKTLGNYDSSAIYPYCPYFKELDSFWSQEIMYIIQSAEIKYTKLPHANELVSDWKRDAIAHISEYKSFAEQICAPYAAAFESVSSQGQLRLYQKRLEQQQNEHSRTIGYITNSTTFVLVYETLRAVHETLKEIENDRTAWNSAIAPQNKMHISLSAKWTQNFSAVFMNGVQCQNNNLCSFLIKNACQMVNIDYADYTRWKNSAEVVNAEQTIKQTQIAAEQRKADLYKQQLDAMQEEIMQLTRKLENIGFAWFGEKRRLKQQYENRLSKLEKELAATVRKSPIPSTTFTYLLNGDPLGRIDNYNYPKWHIVYSENKEAYIVHTPDGRALFHLPDSFVATYGRYRSIVGRLETWVLTAEDNRELHFRFYEEELS